MPQDKGEYYKENKHVWLKSYGKNREKIKQRKAMFRKSHLGYFRSYMKDYRKGIKYDVMFHYSNGEPTCNICHENRMDCLSIDHIHGNGRKHRREIGLSGQGFYQWLKRNDYPAGYQVLCMNCQFIKRAENKECKAGHLTGCPEVRA